MLRLGEPATPAQTNIVGYCRWSKRQCTRQPFKAHQTWGLSLMVESAKAYYKYGLVSETPPPKKKPCSFLGLDDQLAGYVSPPRPQERVGQDVVDANFHIRLLFSPRPGQVAPWLQTCAELDPLPLPTLSGSIDHQPIRGP